MFKQQLRLESNLKKVLKHTPKEYMANIILYIDTLEYNSIPDYDHIAANLEAAMEDHSSCQLYLINYKELNLQQYFKCLAKNEFDVIARALNRNIDGPQALNTLGVDSRRWIYKVDAVVHRLMDVTEVGEVVVTAPHIGPNRSSRSDVPLDNTFQSSGVAPINDFDEYHLRSVLDSTDHPILANDTAYVVLTAHDVGLVHLHDRVRSAELSNVVTVVLDEHISKPLAPLHDRVLLHLERSSHFRDRA
ncbi:hypothetical protein OSTOST_19340 [Ostertagia ostertagi]